ncbi:hypothetical protein DdX_17653 [Ditylenchus destructor]|uniref:Uncharacterized protein n=1 Tax=Ditylenchus destructor TaxID=166010 RepID=A0AAD4QYT0_9BILA|nr:hypothetical protein DdX_17653 [Ditylenchus destructor]
MMKSVNAIKESGQVSANSLTPGSSLISPTPKSCVFFDNVNVLTNAVHIPRSGSAAKLMGKKKRKPVLPEEIEVIRSMHPYKRTGDEQRILNDYWYEQERNKFVRRKLIGGDPYTEKSKTSEIDDDMDKSKESDKSCENLDISFIDEKSCENSDICTVDSESCKIYDISSIERKRQKDRSNSEERALRAHKKKLSRKTQSQKEKGNDPPEILAIKAKRVAERTEEEKRKLNVYNVQQSRDRMSDDKRKAYKEKDRKVHRSQYMSQIDQNKGVKRSFAQSAPCETPSLKSPAVKKEMFRFPDPVRFNDEEDMIVIDDETPWAYG